MSKMILGRKIGMTQIFTESGVRIPVTVVKAGPMVVVQTKSGAGRDGYCAVKVGFEPAARQEKDGDVRWRGLTRAEVGVFEHASIEVPHRIVREFRVSEGELSSYSVGATIDLTSFSEGEMIDVSGTSKGKGFAGVMKRHHFKGFNSSHGAHETFRGGGALGGRKFPGRTFPGYKMAGRMGNKRATIQNLRLVRVLADEGLYLIRGAIPGANGGLVEIRPAVKRIGKL
jgi:large subunit ribosomal protein L3